MSRNDVIYQENRIKPMSNLTYRLMEWVMYVWDIFLRHPQKDLKKVPLKGGMTVIDYACGPGHYTIPLAEIVGPKGRVYAVDIQPLAMETVKKKATKKSLRNIITVLVDSYDTGIPDASADIVIFMDTLHMITDHHALFQEISRLLKPNGLLFMDPGHMKVAKARSIIENTGFFDLAEFDGRNMQLTKRRKI